MFWKLNMTVRLQNHFLHRLLMFIAFVLLNNDNIDKDSSLMEILVYVEQQDL